MSEHDITELRRQYDQAQRRVGDANMAREEAERRLVAALIAEAEAEFAARGITKGARVVGHHNVILGPKTTEVGIYMGHRQGLLHLSMVPVIAKITADGKPHATAFVRSPYGTEWRLA